MPAVTCKYKHFFYLSSCISLVPVFTTEKLVRAFYQIKKRDCGVRKNLGTLARKNLPVIMNKSVNLNCPCVESLTNPIRSLNIVIVLLIIRINYILQPNFAALAPIGRW
jgi:hypothetical protein